MHQIELQFSSKFNREPYKTSVPENWNELTKAQLLQATKCLHTIADADKLHIRLLKVLQVIPKGIPIHILEAWQIVSLKPVTAFLRETNTLTKQLLPTIRLPFLKGFSRLSAPRERFRNLLFLEFIFADTYYLHWCQTRNDEFLHKLLATLYRPKKWFHFFKCRNAGYDGDPRQPFNEHLLADRAEKLKHLPFEVKMAIATWYRGCRNQLEQQYTNVFTAENQESAKGKGGWEPVLRGMAGGKFGDLDKTAKVNIHVILSQMDELIEQAKELEARNRQHQ